MENDSFRLIVRRGPQINEAYELSGDVSNLGRDITNDIVINDREVSRHHLRFTRGADGYTIEDLGSTNGTFVNGKRVAGATALKNGDMVGLGETVTLQFEAGRPGASVPPPAQQQPAQQNQQGQASEAAYQRPDAQAQQQPPAQPQQPPAQQYAPPPQQQQNPYQQPQAQQPAEQDFGFDEPAQGQYQDANAYAPPQDYYGEGEQPGMQQQGGYGPPPPGYDYDPYAMRDEGGSSTTQWILIGCLGLLLLCCCFTVVAAVAIDSLCLYDSVPILNNILDALAIPVNCPS
ncbi:MAG: FHA domain-containing protein [Chloroflexota bacterium]